MATLAPSFGGDEFKTLAITQKLIRHYRCELRFFLANVQARFPWTATDGELDTNHLQSGRGTNALDSIARELERSTKTADRWVAPAHLRQRHPSACCRSNRTAEALPATHRYYLSLLDGEALPESPDAVAHLTWRERHTTVFSTNNKREVMEASKGPERRRCWPAVETLAMTRDRSKRCKAVDGWPSALHQSKSAFTLLQAIPRWQPVGCRRGEEVMPASKLSDA